jgi:hypothetical protein
MSAMVFQPFAKYAIRPGLSQGESLVGYVYRYLATNGYRVNSLQNGVLWRIFSKKPGIAQRNFLQLQQAMEGINEISFERWQEDQKLKEFCIVRWGKHANVYLGFCPQCIKFRPYHLALWELPMVKACPGHGCWLLNVCSHCGRPFDWIRLLPGFICACGEAINAIQGDPAEVKWIDIARKIASAKDVAVPSNIGDLGSLLFPLQGLMLSEIYDQLVLELKFRVRLKQDVPPALLPLSERVAKGEVINVGLNVSDYYSFYG